MLSMALPTFANEALLNAVKSSNFKEVDKIIKKDRTVNINYADENRITPLIHASSVGNVEIVKRLLKARPDLNVVGNIYFERGMTALHVAIMNMHPEVAKLLITAGADVNALDEKYEETPLHGVCYRGYPEIAQMLINRGAHADQKNNIGNVPLGTAANYGHIEIINILLRAGVDINNNNDGHGIALFWAANGWVDSEELITVLLKAGSDINNQSDFGHTALMMAAYRGKLVTVKTLLKFGADKNIKNYKNMTAYDLAKKNGHLEIAELLKL